MLPPTPPVSTDLCTTSVNLLSAPLQACLSLPCQASLSNRKRSTLELQQQQGFAEMHTPNPPDCTLFKEIVVKILSAALCTSLPYVLFLSSGIHFRLFSPYQWFDNDFVSPRISPPVSPPSFVGGGVPSLSCQLQLQSCHCWDICPFFFPPPASQTDTGRRSSATSGLFQGFSARCEEIKPQQSYFVRVKLKLSSRLTSVRAVFWRLDLVAHCTVNKISSCLAEARIMNLAHLMERFPHLVVIRYTYQERAHRKEFF